MGRVLVWEDEKAMELASGDGFTNSATVLNATELYKQSSEG